MPSNLSQLVDILESLVQDAEDIESVIKVAGLPRKVRTIGGQLSSLVDQLRSVAAWALSVEIGQAERAQP